MNLSYVVEGDGSKEKSYEIFSRLLKDRIIYVQGKFDDRVLDKTVEMIWCGEVAFKLDETIKSTHLMPQVII